MKRSRIVNGKGPVDETEQQSNDENPNLYLIQADFPIDGKASSTEVLTPPMTPSRPLSHGDSTIQPQTSTAFRLSPSTSSTSLVNSATTTESGVPKSSFTFSFGAPMSNVCTTQDAVGFKPRLTAFSFHPPQGLAKADQSMAPSPSLLTPISATGLATDRLARLRNLIKKEKTKLH
jgi:hypothetical protein